MKDNLEKMGSVMVRKKKLLVPHLEKCILLNDVKHYVVLDSKLEAEPFNITLMMSQNSEDEIQLIKMKG